MAHFLYISDVFCPWCYGFGPVLRRLVSQYGQYGIRTLCGQLMEDAMTTADMVKEMPQAKEFFQRLEQTTGQAVSPNFLHRLDPDGESMIMHSPAVALPLQVLKSLDPGQAWKQMERFQHAVYGEGLDVLSRQVQHSLAEEFGITAQAFDLALEDTSIQARALAEVEEAETIMGEFVLYPTLYLERDGGRHLLSRGYNSYETVEQALLDIIREGKAEDAHIPEGQACSLDGTC